MARPPVELDIAQLEKLAALHPSQSEVGAFFGVSDRTIRDKLKEEPYKSAWERGLANGALSLRRKQWSKAMDGNVTMLIWLGKNVLGQTDKQEVEMTETTRWVVQSPAPATTMDEWTQANNPANLDDPSPQTH